MTDDKLFAEIATLWVDNGGDDEGIAWCWQKIRDAVREEMRNRGLVSRKDMTDEAHHAQ